MTNECYEPTDFRVDILETQEIPYNYSIICFDECLVEGVPITRNCLHESCFDIEVARGLLTSAFSSEFDKIYFYVGTVEMILLADSPIPILLKNLDQTLKIGSLISEGTPGEFLLQGEESSFIIGSVFDGGSSKITLKKESEGVRVGSVIEAINQSPIILRTVENRTSAGVTITSYLPKKITLRRIDSSIRIGAGPSPNSEPIVLKSQDNTKKIGTAIVSQITENVLKSLKSDLRVGSIVTNIPKKILLENLEHNVYHVIRKTLETFSFDTQIDVKGNRKGIIEGSVEEHPKIEIKITEDGEIDISFIEDGVVEFKKRMEFKL